MTGVSTINEKSENIMIWRSLSCIGVLIYHIFLQCKMDFSFGKYGVLFFFIITGYLAFVSTDVHENRGRYWKKRVVRIMPMYASILLLWMVIFAVQERSIQKSWELLTIDFVGGTWTIWVTIVFYLLAPLLAKVIGSYRKGIIFFLFFCSLRFAYSIYRVQIWTGPGNIFVFAWEEY